MRAPDGGPDRKQPPAAADGWQSLKRAGELLADGECEQVLTVLDGVEPRTDAQRRTRLRLQLRALNRLDRADEALKVARGAARLFPEDDEFVNFAINRALQEAAALLQQGQFDEVLTVLDRVEPCTDAQRQWRLKLHLRTLNRLDRSEDALKLAQEAARRFPEDEEFAGFSVERELQRATALLQQRAHDEVLTLLDRIEPRTDPQRQWRLKLRLRALRGLRRGEEALQVAREAIRQSPGDEEFEIFLLDCALERAAILLDQQQFAEALSVLEDTEARTYTQRLRRVKLRLRALNRLDRAEEALKLAQEAAHHFPEDEEFLWFPIDWELQRAAALLQQGECGKVLNVLNQVEPRTDAQRKWRLKLRLRALNRLDQAEKAVELAQLAARQFPLEEEFLTFLVDRELERATVFLQQDQLDAVLSALQHLEPRTDTHRQRMVRLQLRAFQRLARTEGPPIRMPPPSGHQNAESSSGDRALLVVGAQRSGTTLLNRMLNAHPEIAMVHQQTNFLRLDVSALDNNVQSTLAEACNADRIYSSRMTSALEARVLASLPPEADAGAVYQALIRALTDNRGSRYYGEKYAGRCIEALRFLDMTEDGRIVHIVRDPRDCCASERKRLESAKVDVGMRPYFLQLYNWRIGILIGKYLSHIVPNRYYRIRYEELVTCPKETMQGICRFLNIPYSPAMLEANRFQDDDGSSWAANSLFDPGVRVLQDFRGRWREHLPADEVLFVERFCHEGMTQMGYCPPTERGRWRRGQRRVFAEMLTQANIAAQNAIDHPAYRAYWPANATMRTARPGYTSGR